MASTTFFEANARIGREIGIQAIKKAVYRRVSTQARNNGDMMG